MPYIRKFNGISIHYNMALRSLLPILDTSQEPSVFESHNTKIFDQPYLRPSDDPGQDLEALSSEILLQYILYHRHCNCWKVICVAKI